MTAHPIPSTASSQNVQIRILNDSGAALSGLAYNTAGLEVAYRRLTDASDVVVTLVAGTLGSWDSGGFVEMGDGWYQFGLPDASIVPNQNTRLRVKTAGNNYRYDFISATGSVGGGGAVEHTVCVTADSVPVDGAEVWVTSDINGVNIVAGTLNTDASGEATFMLDPGTYYLWSQKAGVNFTNPQAFTVV